jgi:hypothetical protein
VLPCVASWSPPVAVESIVVVPRMDTQKTPNSELLTLRKSAELLKITPTDMLRRATEFGLSRIVGKNDDGPYLIRKEVLATRKRFDYTQDRIGSSWALFWDTVTPKSARFQVTKRLKQIAVDPKVDRYQERIRNFDAAKMKFAAVHKSAPSFSAGTLAEIKKILFQGVICESRLAEIESAKQAERECFTKLRNCQSFAWESISRFKEASQNSGHVTGFARLERTLIRQAFYIPKKPGEDSRKRHDSSCVSAIAEMQKTINSLPLAIQARQFNFDPVAMFNPQKEQILRNLLRELKSHDGRCLPENWKRLIFGLYGFFMVAEVKKTANKRWIRRKFDVLATRPHLRQYAHQDALPKQLDIFNLFNYLTLVCGWKKTAALEFGGLVCFPNSDSPDALAGARLYRDRFRKVFPIVNLSHL